MKVIDTKLQDVKIIEMDVFGDHRGFFTESYSKAKWFCHFDTERELYVQM